MSLIPLFAVPSVWPVATMPPWQARAAQCLRDSSGNGEVDPFNAIKIQNLRFGIAE